MSSVFKSIALVAGLVVAVAGCDASADPGGSAAPEITPAPASTPPSPSPIASMSASATANASPTVIEMGAGDRQLAAGAYRVADPFRPFTISFPATWTLQTAQLGGVALFRTQPDNFAPGLTIDRVHQVFADPCHPDLAPETGTMASGAIIGMLGDMKGFTAGPVSDVTVGGHPAKSFRLTNDVTFEQAQECEGSPLDIYQGGLGPITTNQGAVDQIWVVDVDGTPVTVRAAWIPGQTPPALIAEVQQVVESIQYDE